MKRTQQQDGPVRVSRLEEGTTPTTTSTSTGGTPMPPVQPKSPLASSTPAKAAAGKSQVHVNKVK